MSIRRVVAVLVALLVLAGCAGGGSDSSEGRAGGAGVVEQHSGAMPPEMAAEDVAPDPGFDMGDDASAIAEEDREIISTASMWLVARDTTEAVDDILRVVAEVGGRVDERTEQASGNGPVAWLIVRVPAAELDNVIADIEEFGEVEELSITADDVTRQGRDLDARIGALEASTQRLLDLMSEADSSEALIAAEEALSRRQAELESLRSQRSYLSEQVALSTLHISVSPERSAEFESGGFIGGLKSGWYALVDFASALLVGLGAVIPWLVVIGVPLTLVVLWWRRRRRRRAVSDVAGD